MPNAKHAGDFPYEEDCTKENCPNFEKEIPSEIHRLKKGVKTYE